MRRTEDEVRKIMCMESEQAAGNITLNTIVISSTYTTTTTTTTKTVSATSLLSAWVTTHLTAAMASSGLMSSFSSAKASSTGFILSSSLCSSGLASNDSLMKAIQNVSLFTGALKVALCFHNLLNSKNLQHSQNVVQKPQRCIMCQGALAEQQAWHSPKIGKWCYLHNFGGSSEMINI